MKTTASLVLTLGAMLAAFCAHAAAPAGAPAGSTGVCKDGSYYDGAEKKGACRGHKGVKDWWGGATAAATPAAPAAPAAKATAPAVAAAPAAPSVSPPVAAAKPAAPAPAASLKPPAKPDTLTAAAGGGPGLVWVNESSKVYHCQGDKWYGKTKQGEYMSESAAKGKGFKGDHGKTCST